MQYTIKVYKNNKLIDGKRTSKKMRFYCFVQANQFSDCVFKLCVNYGKGLKNEGVYKTKQKLIHAFRAFTEK